MTVFLFKHSYFSWGFNYTAVVAETEEDGRAIVKKQFIRPNERDDIELVDSCAAETGKFAGGRYDE